MKRKLWIAAALGLSLASAGFGMTPEERRAYREKLVGILPEVPAFTEWLKKSDALPPDFDALPKHNGLPDPLSFADGRPVKSVQEWGARRKEILELFQKYAWGKFPPHAKVSSVEVVSETPGEGYRTREVVLHFGPAGKEQSGVMHCTMIIPEGKGPFPVLMGPGLIGGFGGNTANAVFRRGYIVLSYAGNDSNDDTKGLTALYPEYDFATLPRRAWGASEVLDYLETVPEVDMKKVAIYGYSRDGKQVMIAGALDERIAGVIAGSTGVGGVLPYRLAGERNQAEGIESTTKMFPDWFVPGLRFFAGREDRLPVDGNLLLALVAPRPVLMISGYNDEVSNTWGDEQSLHSAQKAYALLGAGDKVGLYRVPGFHGANDMEVALDFLDEQFGRQERKWTSQFVFPWDWQKWRENSGERVDLAKFPAKAGGDVLSGVTSTAAWEERAGEVKKSVEWMLGEEPAMIAPAAGRGGGRGFAGRGGRGGPGGRGGAAGRGRGAAAGAGGGGGNPGQVMPDVPGWVIQRSMAGTQEFGWFVEEGEQTASRPVTFGDGVRGTIYYPANLEAGKKLPAVVWLHSYSYPLGYMWVYRRELHPILALVKAGYAVLAYDQAGFGSRMAEAGPFYDRHPHWSLMGRMVEDVHGAVEMLTKDAAVDGEHVYLYGYSMGGLVALHAAATDPRIKGVVSIAAFTPMRTDTAEKGTGGLARFSIERPLMPRLGFFIGQEARVPYDYDELIAAIAPRPVLVVEPQLDRDATVSDVHAAVEKARGIYALYGAAEKLGLQEPWDYNRLPTAVQEQAIGWMDKNMRK
jgi:dienelactone hydrolase